MRVLQSSIYSNFISDQKSAKNEINSLTATLSSGKKIAHSYENSYIYEQTLRLDSEINSYRSIQDRAQKAKVLTDSSDGALSSALDLIKSIRNRVLQASNETVNDEGLKSIAIDIENQKDSILRLLNSTANGEYIFAGSAVNVKPFNEKGEYQASESALEVAIDRANRTPYSIPGSDIAFGLRDDVKKTISTNVKLLSQNLADAGTNRAITLEDSIEDLTGESGTNYFYIDGTRHNGENFKTKIALNASDKVSDLIGKISDAFGEGVEVSLSSDATIVIKDQLKGRSSLDFQMVASTENVTKTSQLTQKFAFNKSSAEFAVNGIDDSAYFQSDGYKLVGNMPLFSKDGFASASTTLSESAHASLDGKRFKMDLVDINGNSRSVTIDLSDNSTFTLDGQTFDITDASVDPTTNQAISTKADAFTFGQLSGIISLALSGETPTSNTKEDIDSAITKAKGIVSVRVNEDGLLEANNLSKNSTKMKLALYDIDSDDFSKSGSLKFMSNRSVINEDNRVNLFKDLDEIIEALKSGHRRVGDQNGNDPKNIGVANALSKIDNLFNHLGDQLSKVGSLSNNLQNIHDRAQTLEVNMKEFKSKVADADVAEVAIKFQQVSLAYQAMMSTIAKVNSLTLLNYLK